MAGLGGLSGLWGTMLAPLFGGDMATAPERAVLIVCGLSSAMAGALFALDALVRWLDARRAPGVDTSWGFLFVCVAMLFAGFVIPAVEKSVGLPQLSLIALSVAVAIAVAVALVLARRWLRRAAHERR